MKKFTKKVAIATTLGTVAGSASAAVPANVTTALGDALTDTTTVAGLSLIVFVTVATFRYMRRAV